MISLEADDSGTCCIIPCFDVAALCGEVVSEALSYADYVVAVDDGSRDTTGAVLKSIEGASSRLHVISYSVNRGKGAALIEGFRYAFNHLPFRIVVTMDADQQHRPCDIPLLIGTCREDDADMVIGERKDILERIPIKSRLGNMMARGLLEAFYSRCPQDTQSGFRAFKREFVEEIARVVRGGRYETEFNILVLALSERRRIASVPIPAIYKDGNKSSHFRPFTDTMRIFRSFIRFRRTGFLM